MKKQNDMPTKIAALTIIPVKDLFEDRAKKLYVMSDGTLKVGNVTYNPTSISNLSPHLDKPTIGVIFTNKSGGSWVRVHFKPLARIVFGNARLSNIRGWHTLDGKETFSIWGELSVDSLYESLKRSPSCRKGW